jgi:SAM-dependent methyltransferase
MSEDASDVLPVTAKELAQWPYEDRRRPTRSMRHYLSLRPLVEQLRSEIDRLIAGRNNLQVLDVGCGGKPYLPLLAPYAKAYVGVDAVAGAAVDDIAVAEQLPYGDASFDVVICTQVLEHVDDPAQALSEIARVLRPGGVTFLSTHGVYLYHPDPPDSDRDYWRWTHSGLARIFNQAADWQELKVQAQGDVMACLGYILAQYADELGKKTRIPALGRALVGLVNVVAEWLDARFPPNARFPRPGSMSSNYLVTAVKPAA